MHHIGVVLGGVQGLQQGQQTQGHPVGIDETLLLIQLEHGTLEEQHLVTVLHFTETLLQVQVDCLLSRQLFVPLATLQLDGDDVLPGLGDERGVVVEGVMGQEGGHQDAVAQ